MMRQKKKPKKQLVLDNQESIKSKIEMWQQAQLLVQNTVKSAETRIDYLPIP